jgi:hypothetical protein
MTIYWFDSMKDYVTAVAQTVAHIRSIEDYLVERKVSGFCINCKRIVLYTVRSGSKLGDFMV